MNPAQRASVERPSGSGFFAPPLRDAVAMLRAGLARGDPLLLLTGDAGTGKTTVARRLLEELDAQRYALGGIFGAYAEGDALLSLVVQDLGMRPHAPGDAFLTLEQFLRRCDNAGREAVLLIDEAHALDADALRQLWQLAAPPAGGVARLQVVLVAQQQPDAVTELTRGGRTPPIGTRCHLRTLQAAETREFVLDRLRSAVGSAQPAFGAEALDAIHERSGGVLRRINLLCDRILMFLAMEGRREVSAPVVAAVDAQLRGELRGPGPSELQAVPPLARTRQLAPATPAAGTAAPRAISSRRPWPAGRLAAGVLLLAALAVLGLILRAPTPAPTAEAAAQGPSLQVPDPSPAALAPTAAPALCSGPADTLGLCAATTAARPDAMPQGPAATPVDDPRTRPPACAPERVALGLCDAP